MSKKHLFQMRFSMTPFRKNKKREKVFISGWFYARIFALSISIMKTQDLKKIVDKYSPEQLEACIRQQLEKGKNACDVVDEADEVIASLSKAEVVRELTDQGMTFSEALRELGKRIRAVYGKED